MTKASSVLSSGPMAVCSAWSSALEPPPPPALICFAGISPFQPAVETSFCFSFFRPAPSCPRGTHRHRNPPGRPRRPRRGHRRRRRHDAGHRAVKSPRSVAAHARPRTARRRRIGFCQNRVSASLSPKLKLRVLRPRRPARRSRRNAAEDFRPCPRYFERRTRRAEFRPATFRRGHLDCAIRRGRQRHEAQKFSTREKQRPAGGDLKNMPSPAAAGKIIASDCST